MKNNFIELDGKQAWLRLIIIFTMSVIGTAGMWSVVIIMPNIQNEFGLDRAASTYPYVATMFGYGIGNVIIGRMLDKIGIRKPIIFALILLVSSYLFSVLATNVFWLSIIQFFLGFSAAAFFGPMMADISKFFYKRKGLAVSLVASGQHLCGAIDPDDSDFDMSKAVTLTGKARSMTIHHARTLHGSSPNNSNRDRLVLFYECNSADAWPLVGAGAYMKSTNPVQLCNQLEKQMVCGKVSYQPRMDNVPVTIPLPPAPDYGSIFTSQKTGGAKSAF